MPDAHGAPTSTSPARAPRARRGVGALLALASILPVAAEYAAAEEAVRVPGTSVRLTPPEGFVPAERFPGFAHEASRSSIQVTVLPAPLSETRGGMTKEGLARAGMTLLASSAETVNGQAATLLHATQRAGDLDVEKWLVVAGDDRATVLLVATTSAPAEPTLRAGLRRAILGATWDPASPDDPFEGLPFRLRPSGTLTSLRRLGNSLLVTEAGPRPPAAERAALYVVGVSTDPVSVPSLAAFAAQRAARTATTKDLEVRQGREVRVAGHDAYELLADAKDAQTAVPMFLYQVVVLDGTGYWLVQGLVVAERSAECLPQFRRLTASIERQVAPPPAPPAAPEEGAPARPPAEGSKPPIPAPAGGR